MAEIYSMTILITAKTTKDMCMLLEQMCENVIEAWGERSFSKAQLGKAKNNIRILSKLLEKSNDDRINSLCYFNPEPDRGAETGYISQYHVSGYPVIEIGMDLKWGVSGQPAGFCCELDTDIFGYSIKGDGYGWGYKGINNNSLDCPNLNRTQTKLSEIAYYENRYGYEGYERHIAREIRKNKCGSEDGYDWRVEDDGTLVLSPTDGDSFIEFTCDDLPWKVLVKTITSFRCEGIIRATGSLQELFNRYPHLKSCDFTNLDISNVTNISSMFYNCRSLQTLDLSGFNTSHVSDMHSMFSGCKSLESLDLSHFDTSNTTDISYMFCDCSSLQSLDLTNFDTSNVTSMRGMFQGCRKLETLDLSSFKIMKVEDKTDIFSGCKSLKEVKGSLSEEVTGMQS